MSLEELKATLRRFPKLLGGFGILTTAGIILYETPQIRKYFSRYVDKKPQEPDKRRTEYIYIKYHIYRESMRKLQQKQEDDKKWISVIINPIGKWWKSAKHSVAWRLLNIAQNGSQAERLKAVQQLVCMDHLKDWDFRHLAQICDARTSVSLARCGADVRWFMPMPKRGCFKNPKILLSEMHVMLARLRPMSCVNHFFSKYFPEQSTNIDHNNEFFTQDQSTSLSSADTDLMKEIISFLHHITKDPHIAAKIIHDGGLTHLMELRKIFTDDNETLSTLCKVLANLSLVPDAVEHFFVSGWVGALAEWQQCPDLRLQVISAKTMANLDHDDPNQSTYPPNVYPLHPRLRTRRKPKADIVFVHGLLGGVFITWRQRDRKPTELGLYGKNAFYTSETDDVFLVGEQKRVNGSKHQHQPKRSKRLIPTQAQAAGDAAKTNAVKKDGINDALLKTSTKVEEKRLNISDAATKEFVETLRNEAELDSDWEVVHPDVPLQASENCRGMFSVSGNEWCNQDSCDEYTNCWPMEWLPDDFPDSRIIGIDYTSAVTEWSANFTKYCPCEKGQGHIDVRASTLLERISTSDVGNGRPVVWIGHSMGGLLTKLILLKSLDSSEPRVQQIAKNTKGIVFLGTPHRGSSIAKWKQHMQMILSPSIEVKEMEENSPKLLELHRRFMGCLHTCLRHVNVLSVAEGSPTMLTTFKFPLRIVTEESSRIDFGDFFLLKDDHLSLSKPIYRQSFLYQRLLHVIGEAITHNGGSKDADEQSMLQTDIIAINIVAAILKSAKGLFEMIPRVALRFST